MLLLNQIILYVLEDQLTEEAKNEIKEIKDIEKSWREKEWRNKW